MGVEGFLESQLGRRLSFKKIINQQFYENFK